MEGESTMKHRLGAALLANLLLLNLLPSAACAYADVPENHWASAYINRADQQGWMHESGENFTPRRTVTGTETIAILTNALFSENEVSKRDEGTAWLTAGTADISSAPVSRYNMAQILINVMNAKQASVQGQAPAFRDWDDIPEQYRHAVSSCFQAGLFVGKDGCFSGDDPLTRAELAALLYRTENLLTGAENLSTSYFVGAIPSSDTDSDGINIASSAVPLAPAPDLQQDTVLAEAIRLTNAERAAAGLPALVADDMLCAAAQVRAGEIGQSFSHTRPDGSACFTVLSDEAKRGASKMGENILTGSESPSKIVQFWMNSSGHRENILGKDFTHIGMAHSGGSWVQIFVCIPG